MIETTDPKYKDEKESKDYLSLGDDSEYYREHIHRYTKTDIRSSRSLEKLLARL